MCWLLLTLFAIAVTCHVPAFGNSSVHIPSAPAVPFTTLKPSAGVAVIAAPGVVVTTNFGVMPVWIA